MNSINFQASFHNLSQIDKVQDEAHRAPVVHQGQNADLDREAVARRLDMPVQPDETEGKIIDPKDRREEQRRNRQRRKRQNEKKQTPGKHRDGRFIDIDV